MIPLGNWEETNDELRNDIAGLEDDIAEMDNINAALVKENEQLQSALNAADNDIADYLFELDHLHHKYTELELDVEGLLMLVEYWQEKALTAEDHVKRLKENLVAANQEAYEAWTDKNDLETYSISIEESRELTTRNLELEQENYDLANSYAEVVNAYLELKKALRTLSE